MLPKLMKPTLLWGNFRVFCFGSRACCVGLTFCLGCEHNMDLEAGAGCVELFGDFVFFTGVKDVVLKSFEVHSLEFLASQIQKEDFIDVDPSVLVELFSSLFPNPSFLRVIGKLFAQWPLAPTSTANKSTLHPLDDIIVERGVYFPSFTECHVSIFSSQGQVSSIMMILFKELEYMTISGRRVVIVMCGGKT